MGILLLIGTGLHAQTTEVTGKVTDPSGSPIPNASVRVKGVRGGTSADANGMFKIRVAPNAVLIVSGVGFEAAEIAVSGRTSLTLSLKSGNSALSEVVVTALGREKDKKALGFAVSSVKAKDLEQRPEGDIGRLLNGKAPGVNVLASSGISGSGTNISIRGVSTITGGAATPLFVVDGVPFDGGTNVNANFQYGGGISTSSRFLDLDPNNIENVNILKGLAASVLYGEAGRNGVIVVTTKNGSGRHTPKKMEITGTQSIFVNKVANLPDYTHRYGGGFDLAPSAAFSNWGAEFTNPPLMVAYSPSLQAAYPDRYAGKQQGYQYYNSVPKFFRTGVISTSSINVGASGPNTTFNANYTYMDDEGFTPNNRVYKNNFGLGGTAKLANKFSANAVLNFAITDMQTPTVGANGGGGSADIASVFGNLLFTPTSINMMGLPYQNPVDGSSVYYRGGNDIENPNWTAHNNISSDKTYRTYGTLGLKYDFSPGFSLNYRFGADIYAEYQTLSVNKGGKQGNAAYQTGTYRTTNIQNTILNHTLSLTYNTNLTNDLTLNVDAGGDLRHDSYNQNGLLSNQQLVFGLFDHSNFVSHDVKDEGDNDLDYKTELIREGIYAQAAFGYKDYLYLTASGRHDWVSTLEPDNRRKLYPSVSISFIPTSAFRFLQDNKTINYLKLRAGYATSAHFPSPYNTRSSLTIQTNAFIDKTGKVINTGAIPNTLPNPNLKPELIRELEAGIEGRFFDNRITLDVTGYFRTAKNQLLDRQLDASSGYDKIQINAGAVDNKGLEVQMGYTVIRNQDWRWDLTGNFTLNRSKVHDMPEDIKQIQIAGYAGGPGTYALNGKPLGILQGSYVQVDDKSGKGIVDANGYFLGSSDIGFIGDPNAKYNLTGISVLSYKWISFRMQWDYVRGGAIWSNTIRTMLSRGVTKDTDFDRTLPYVIPNTVKQDGTPNDIQQSVDNIYFNSYGFGPASVTVWDGTVVRLRELSLAFSLPAKILKSSPFGSASVSLSGTNLWYLAPNVPKHTNYDPESNSLGVGNAKGIDLFAGPSSRRMGATLRLTF
jgi:TonB-linked SusC/RagA family outer membrane protein